MILFKDNNMAPKGKRKYQKYESLKTQVIIIYLILKL